MCLSVCQNIQVCVKIVYADNSVEGRYNATQYDKIIHKQLQ